MKNEKSNLTKDNDIPLGLGMAFAQNADAMLCFSQILKDDRQAFIERASKVKSKREMQALVAEIEPKTTM